MSHAPNTLTAPHRPASVVPDSLAADRLGTLSVMFFEISSAAPLTVIAGVVTTALAVTHVIALPLAFTLVAAALTLFVPGFLAMSRSITNAGAFYAYVSQGLGRALGVGSAFVALIAYNALQVGLYGAGVWSAPAWSSSGPTTTSPGTSRRRGWRW